jgi:hypothetical protein
MHSRYIRRYVGPILAACVALTFLVGCGNDQTNKSGTFFGPPRASETVRPKPT